MKRTLLVALSLVICVSLAASLAMAKNPATAKDLKFRVDFQGSQRSLDNDMDPWSYQSAAAQGTTFLAYFTFDSGPSCTPEGWTHADVTEQSGDFFHVDNYAGLVTSGSGVFNVVPLEGSQGMWGGKRVDATPPFCGYSALPGYGNNWNQAFCTKACLAVDTSTAQVSVDFLVAWDSEPGYDATALEYEANCNDAGPDNWVAFDGGLTVWDGAGAGYWHSEVPNGHSTSIKIRFHFTSDGAWSDEDALWDTDGFFHIDSLSVSDSGGLVLAVEDFEGEALNAPDSDDWESCTPPGYGDFAALYPALTLVQEDPCLSNLTCVWTFYTGSTDNYGCGGFPLQTAVPYQNLRNQYISNEVWSPLIPWVGSGVGAELRFDVYRDLALDPLVFYVWHIRSWVAGCPGGWQDRNFVYFGGGKDWLRSTFPFGDLVQSGASDIQIAVGVADMCPFWCGIFGSGACHSHSPLIDNVEAYRLDVVGPQWSVRDIDLFQDTFAEDGTTTGTANADMAIDILPSASFNNIEPGDSAVCDVSDPQYGLATDPNTGTGSAVYAYLTVWPDGTKFGPDVVSPDQSNNGYVRYPLVDSLLHDGKWWYCVRFDTSFTDGNARTGAQDDRFAVDFNDNVFTPCDTICFVFCAENTNGDRTYFSFPIGSTNVLWEALDNPMEFTVLPAGGWKRGGDVLYVDGMNFRGSQPFFDDAFTELGLIDKIDRYDIRGPSSSVANRPGSRVQNVENQLLNCYRKIIWETGNLSNGTIGDGTGNPEKSDDAQMLFDFLNGLDNPGGVYFSGDDIANELSGLAGSGAIDLRSVFINYTLVNDDHVAQGLGISPFVYGEDNGCFDHVTGNDQWVAYGGCPLINDFDVISPSGTATLEASYYTGSGGTGSSGGAVVGQKTLNADSTIVGVLLSGHSFIYVRDDAGGGSGTVPDRWHLMDDILTWLGNEVPDPIPVLPQTTAKNELRQSVPNPFNPTTTIKYQVKDRGHVSLKVYNVAGQLIRTLVDDVQEPGILHSTVWRGLNDQGQNVSSGVYFYKLVTKNFSQTKKMVLLK